MALADMGEQRSALPPHSKKVMHFIPAGGFLCCFSMLSCVHSRQLLAPLALWEIVSLHTCTSMKKIMRPHGEAARWCKSCLTVALTHAAKLIQLLQLSRVGRSGQLMGFYRLTHANKSCVPVIQVVFNNLWFWWYLFQLKKQEKKLFREPFLTQQWNESNTTMIKKSYSNRHPTTPEISLQPH